MSRPTKAYRNIDFLTGPDARSIRILCEYLEPLQRLREEQVGRALIFFGSARARADGLRSEDYAAARELARRLARWTVDAHPPEQRFRICTGGGPGIMQAAHEGAAEIDSALNVGLNISLPFEQHVNPHVSEALAFEFHYFFMRKLWFANLAHGVVVFPGGFGTFDELFELLTLMQTGKLMQVPLVLFGKRFWQRAVDVGLLAEEGLILPQDQELFLLTDRIDEAESYLRERAPAVVRDR